MKADMTRLIAAVLVLGIAIGVSFGAGTVYGRGTAKASTQPSSSGTAGTGGLGRFSGTPPAGFGGTPGPGGFSGTPPAGFSGTPGPGGFGGRQITGTIQSINGNTLNVTTTGGIQMSVTLADTTQIGNVSTGDRTALAAGASILVVGSRQSDGTTSATSVLVLPAGFLGQ
jgi:hypothetical protein